MEPQHKIIGTVTHTMEAQTPVTDFMYKNFKQTEKLKKKYTAAKTKLKKTKQELEDVKSRKPEPTYTTTEATSPKKDSNICEKYHIQEISAKRKS